MSFENFLGDVFSGNEEHAWQRIKDYWATVSPLVKKFESTLATDEGKILEGLVTTAAQDVISGGLTTASFVAAASDVESKLISQNITMAKTDIFAALNTAVGMANAASDPTPAAVDTPVASPAAAS